MDHKNHVDASDSEGYFLRKKNQLACQNAINSVNLCYICYNKCY